MKWTWQQLFRKYSRNVEGMCILQFPHQFQPNSMFADEHCFVNQLPQRLNISSSSVYICRVRKRFSINCWGLSLPCPYLLPTGSSRGFIRWVHNPAEPIAISLLSFDFLYSLCTLFCCLWIYCSAFSNVIFPIILFTFSSAYVFI